MVKQSRHVNENILYYAKLLASPTSLLKKEFLELNREVRNFLVTGKVVDIDNHRLSKELTSYTADI